MESFIFAIWETPEFKGSLFFIIGISLLLLSIRKSRYVRRITGIISMGMVVGLTFFCATLANPTEKEQIALFLTQLKSDLVRDQANQTLHFAARHFDLTVASTELFQKANKKQKSPTFFRSIQFQILQIEPLSSGVFEVQLTSRPTTVGQQNRKMMHKRVIWTLKLRKRKCSKVWKIESLKKSRWKVNYLEV